MKNKVLRTLTPRQTTKGLIPSTMVRRQSSEGVSPILSHSILIRRKEWATTSTFKEKKLVSPTELFSHWFHLTRLSLPSKKLHVKYYELGANCWDQNQWWKNQRPTSSEKLWFKKVRARYILETIRHNLNQICTRIQEWNSYIASLTRNKIISI